MDGQYRKRIGMSNHNPPNQWQPGQSGNPNGRPKKGESWSDIFSKKFEEMDGEVTRKEAVAEKLIKLVEDTEGDEANPHLALNAAKFIIEHMDGKAQQKVQMTGADDGPVKIQVDFIGGEDE